MKGIVYKRIKQYCFTLNDAAFIAECLNKSACYVESPERMGESIMGSVEVDRQASCRELADPVETIKLWQSCELAYLMENGIAFVAAEQAPVANGALVSLKG